MFSRTFKVLVSVAIANINTNVLLIILKILFSQIPSDELITKQNYTVKVESSRCFMFRHEVQLPLERKRLFISSHTDKKTYLPGEKSIIIIIIIIIIILKLIV